MQVVVCNQGSVFPTIMWGLKSQQHPMIRALGLLHLGPTYLIDIRYCSNWTGTMNTFSSVGLYGLCEKHLSCTDSKHTDEAMAGASPISIVAITIQQVRCATGQIIRRCKIHFTLRYEVTNGSTYLPSAHTGFKDHATGIWAPPCASG